MGKPEDENCSDGRNGLSHFSIRGHPVGGSVREEDHGHGIVIPGEAGSQGAVLGV